MMNQQQRRRAMPLVEYEGQDIGGNNMSDESNDEMSVAVSEEPSSDAKPSRRSMSSAGHMRRSRKSVGPAPDDYAQLANPDKLGRRSRRMEEDDGEGPSDEQMEDDEDDGGEGPSDEMEAEEDEEGGDEEMSSNAGSFVAPDGTRASDYEDTRQFPQNRGAMYQRYANPEREKVYMYNRIKRLADNKQIEMPPITPESSFKTIRMYYEMVSADRRVKASKEMQANFLIGMTRGLELANSKYDFMGLNLDGYTDSVAMNIMEYDDIFERIHEKYASRVGEIDPLIELMIAWGGGAMFYSGLANSTKNQTQASSDQDIIATIERNPEIQERIARMFVEKQMEMQRQQYAHMQQHRTVVRRSPGRVSGFAPRSSTSRTTTAVVPPPQRVVSSTAEPTGKMIDAELLHAHLNNVVKGKSGATGSEPMLPPPPKMRLKTAAQRAAEAAAAATSPDVPQLVGNLPPVVPSPTLSSARSSVSRHSSVASDQEQTISIAASTPSRRGGRGRGRGRGGASSRRSTPAAAQPPPLDLTG